jgi:hypothetical protein
MREIVLAAFLGGLALGACARPSSGGAGSGSTDSAACKPRTLGLGDAKPVAMWKLPGACHPRSAGGGVDPPVAIESEERFRALFECVNDTPPGIDFAETTFVFAMRELSPAGVGIDIVDDGKTVTFINRFRPPCPGDPHPMPMPYPVSFLLPDKAPRTFTEAACNVESRCD